MRIAAYLFAFFTLSITCYAQEISPEVIADDLFGFQDEDENHEDLFENIVQIMANPVNLNTVKAEELRALHILSEYQLQQFFKHRSINGNLLDSYELQTIDGFDRTTIDRLLPFIYVQDPAAGFNRKFVSRLSSFSNTYFVVRYERLHEQKRGFTEEDAERRFFNTPGKTYARFKTGRPHDYSAGFTLENDAGESWQWSPSARYYGFDHVSAHVQLMNKGFIKNLIVGDYQVQAGQGLVAGGAFAMGKGGETIVTARRSNVGARPYTSVNENNFMRGAYVKLEVTKRVYLSALYSKNYRDATTTQRDSTDELVATSFRTTGLHRNQSELNGRKSITEENKGIILDYQHQGFECGLIALQTKFNPGVLRNETPYNQFAFSGTQLTTTSMYVNYSFNNIGLFSEVAQNIKGGTGMVFGALSSFSRNLDIALLYRYYAPGFISFYANAFSESSTPQNERGTYWGWKYSINRRYSFAGYVDLFEFPWLRYRSYRPSHGHEWLIRFNYQPTRKIFLFTQWREETKIRNMSGTGNLYQTQSITKTNLTMSAVYPVHERLTMKSRVQASTFTHALKTKGLALVQDVQFKPLKKVRITARYAMFDTDDYDNRQYVFEPDVWLAYSFPMLDGNGVRNVVMMDYQLTRQVTCWIRYSRTRYTDRETIGSGLDMTNGDQRNEIKIQVRYRI